MIAKVNSDPKISNSACRNIGRLKMKTGTASSVAVSDVLNTNNYYFGAFKWEPILIAQDLWDIVEATDECPKQEDDEVDSKACVGLR